MIPLILLPSDNNQSRVTRDRLELLTALITAPGFDSLYRAEIIAFPPQHPVYAWQCSIEGCGRVRRAGTNDCNTHFKEWTAARTAGSSRADFLHSALPLPPKMGTDWDSCTVCPDRPARSRSGTLCIAHHDSWRKLCKRLGKDAADYDQWLARQQPLPSYGTCQVSVCSENAASPMGLCAQHKPIYYGQLRHRAHPALDNGHGSSDTSSARTEIFRRWCANEDPIYRIGVINLVGLRPQLGAEMQWGLWAHTQTKNHSTWDLAAVQRLVNHCRHRHLTSLFDLLASPGEQGDGQVTFGTDMTMIIGEITAGLRCIYYSPQDTKDAGFLETHHFGRRFQHTKSNYDLTAVTQRWLRDLLWEHLASVLRSPKCPRSRGPFDNLRRSCAELSAFLEVDAPEGGHNPTLLREEHGQRFVADLRNRARHGLISLGLVRVDGQPSMVTDNTRRFVFNAVRRLLYGALEAGEAARIGLDPGFIRSVPFGGGQIKRARNPFTDQVARALADEMNLERLAELDPHDRGLRDIWEVIVHTGRRGNEVVGLKLDCIGRYGGLPMLWHDQTKVGNYNEAIRIPEKLYARIDERRHKTLIRFEHRHGRLPMAGERALIALFPTAVRNPHEDQAVSRQHFSRCFKIWIDRLDLGVVVAHQARHTLATNLLRAGASLAQIRRYLGHVSERMAEHYTNVAHSDLEDVLHTVWVAGPGASSPGEFLSGGSESLTREEALALAIDLSRRSTPTDGGFCTFQPVVNGEVCPWSMDCENCDKFVLSGADLLYWRRKQEQWRSVAERAPDDATADYLHQVFEPTARAIAGLEKALAGLGLLDQALVMDLRRPQDYFHRIWSTNFRATDLADLAENDSPLDPLTEQSA